MRTVKKLINSWQVTPCALGIVQTDIPEGNEWSDVAIPHVANINDPTAQGAWLYRCNVNVENIDKPTYLDFGAVGNLCRVWLNGQYLAEHLGGFSRFRVHLNTALKCGENQLYVLADNVRTGNWNPMSGDFNNYAGIYRPVNLVQTENAHFDMMYYGTTGLEIEAADDGTVSLNARIVNVEDNLSVVYIIEDEASVCASAERAADTPKAVIKLSEPKLWNGLEAPRLYRCTAKLMKNHVCLDQVSLPFGLRNMEMTPDKGFFLNGKHLKICGVAKHQDWAGVAFAVNEAQQQRDIQLIQELGANAVRLSHYQHPDNTYDLCDQAGMVVWAEIPLLSLPDGSVPLFENAKQQIKELVLQQKHHPCICFWGLENEIAIQGESLEMYRRVAELHQFTKALDPTRPTTLANLNGVRINSQLNQITDMVGYNLYYGWYYGKMGDLGPFMDKFHAANPNMPLGISEYGADCSVNLHRDDPKVGDYSEEFQALFHEKTYPDIAHRDFIWGSFVWNMFDFASGIRNVGDMHGLNCKGLATYDRAVCKDAYYYYKAWWSKAAFVHLTGRRYARRCGETTTVKVYSNLPEVTLLVNHQPFATQSGDKVFEFRNVPLTEGDMTVEAVAGAQHDEMVLTKVAEPERSYIYDNPNPGFNVDNWFTQEEDKEDLFPEGYFSIMSEMGDLRATEAAWTLLEKEVPEITANPRSAKMPHMTLLRIINFNSSQYKEDFVKELNLKLNKIANPFAD